MVKFQHIFLIYLSIFILDCSGNKLNSGGLIDPNFDKAMKYFNEEKYMRAKEEFKIIMMDDPLSQHANDSQFYIDECNYYLDAFDQAVVEYEKYLRMAYQRYSLSKKSEIMLCRCYYQLSLDYKKDQSGTMHALTKLQYFIEKESMKENKDEIEEMINDLRTKLAKKEFETGKFYIRVQEYESAEMYFKNVLDEYYDTPYFDDSIVNLSLLISFENKKEAITLIKLNENNFSTKLKYESAIILIDGLNLNEEIEYYLKLIK